MGAHLMINTFGGAKLLYMDKEVADSSEPTKHPVGTIDFKFLVRVNRNGSFDIQPKIVGPFNVTIESAAKVCQVKVGTDSISVPPWYTVKGDVLTQKYSARPMAEISADEHFRVKLENSELFRRIDVRYQQQSWATLIVSHNQLMKMCLNASREMEILQWACADIIDQAKSRRPDVTVKQLGLVAERVAKRKEDDNESVRSMASATDRGRPTSFRPAIANQQAAPIPVLNSPSHSKEQSPETLFDMPRLVLASHANQIRDTYIQQLNVALASVKLPSFETNPNN